MKDVSFLAYWHLTLILAFIKLFLLFSWLIFSSSAIWLNQELPHNTIKNAYRFPLLPLRWSIIAMTLTDICMIIAAKFIPLAEILPLSQQYIFQTCLLYVYIQMLQGHFRFNMSKSYFETFPQNAFLFLLIALQGAIITHQKLKICLCSFSLSHPQNQMYWQLISISAECGSNPLSALDNDFYDHIFRNKYISLRKFLWLPTWSFIFNPL